MEFRLSSPGTSIVGCFVNFPPLFMGDPLGAVGAKQHLSFIHATMKVLGDDTLALRKGSIHNFIP